MHLWTIQMTEGFQTLTVMEQFQITIFNKQYNDHNYKIMELIKLANTVKMQKK